MIQTFNIGSFRKLKSLDLTNLGDFNLVVGKNNAGKTSILEAIGVGLSMGDTREILSIARKRDSRSNVVFSGSSYLADIVSWMFPAPETSFWSIGFSGDINLKFSIDDVLYMNDMHCERLFHIPTDEVSVDGYPDNYEPLRGVEVTTIICEQLPLEQNPREILSNRFSLGERTVDREAVGARRPLSQKVPFEYISPYSHRNSSVSEHYIRRIQDNSEKKELLKLIRSIDDDIDDIVYEPYLGDPSARGARSSRGGRAVVRTRAHKYIPLSAMGDGFRRICEIGFGLHFSKGGVLLIDEIEAGFHVGMLEFVYPWLVRQADRSGVQVIATTHSLEAIQAMVDATPAKSRRDALRAYVIGLEKPFSRVRYYYGDELHSLITENGLDIR